MASKESKRFVIDASVARAVGETEHPISKSCRDFLSEVLRVCHHLVITKDISQEWKNHQSRFASKWRSSMTARRKIKYLDQDQLNNIVLRSEIFKTTANEKVHNALLKDLHLIEAAMATDCVIISLDEQARKLYHRISRKISALKNVVWVNPTKKDAIEYLRSRASLKKKR
ncbi:MAG: hypothetical protein JRI22_02515 [Deltaproteobacteria bacterium]|nr:hypothetical protein [Deltaproteobacteria bacterium]